MIEVKNLSKVFPPGLVAVENLSFSAKPGEVMGLLGPNGAGKSTTMKMINCFVTPTAGDIHVCGHDTRTQPVEVRQCIGYMPENSPLYSEMKVGDFLEFIADLRGLTAQAKKDAVERAVHLCQLENVYFQNIETLSKGFQRRVSLAQALIHDPQVLILDEPTDGLDPNQKHDVRQLIKKMAPSKTIIISTHILEEVESVCDRVVIMAKGKKEFDGTPRLLKDKSKLGRVEDVFRALTTGQQVEGVML